MDTPVEICSKAWMNSAMFSSRMGEFAKNLSQSRSAAPAATI